MVARWFSVLDPPKAVGSSPMLLALALAESHLRQGQIFELFASHAPILWLTTLYRTSSSRRISFFSFARGFKQGEAGEGE